MTGVTERRHCPSPSVLPLDVLEKLPMIGRLPLGTTAQPAFGERREAGGLRRAPSRLQAEARSATVVHRPMMLLHSSRRVIPNRRLQLLIEGALKISLTMRKVLFIAHRRAARVA